jgi:hypothetical protein
VCGKSTCKSTLGPGDINVRQLILTTREASGPFLSSPTGLWQATGWVKGAWTLTASGDSPSGICAIAASFGGQVLPGGGSPRDPSAWHQCAAAPVTDRVITQGYSQGANSLDLSATDAAGASVSYSKTVYVDNQPSTVALSGPPIAASTAGPQHVTATAAAGPSGVAGVSCSADGGLAHWYPSSTAQVPVSGVGEHVVRCFSENNAVDANGGHGTSATESFSMTIGTPTITAITFSKLVDKLRCRRVAGRVTVPAPWGTVKRGHKRIRVRRPAHTKTIKVTKCHARTVIRHRTVWVTLRRHGKSVRVKRHKTIRPTSVTPV